VQGHRKLKPKLPLVEPVPLTIEEDLSQNDRPEGIKAQGRPPLP